MTVAVLSSASHQAKVLRTENPQFFLPIRPAVARAEESAKDIQEDDFRPRWWRAEEWDLR
jgi:hypothetical protein